MMKKFISLILLVCLGVGILPTPSFAAYPNDKEEFFEMLDNMGEETINSGDLEANFQTYEKYNLIVYGLPFGEMGTSICPDKPQDQPRYLGYTVNHTKYANTCFRPDATKDDPQDWSTYLKQSEGVKSWEKLSTSQREFLKKTSLYGNNAGPNYTVNYISQKMTGGIGAYNIYTKVQSPPKWRIGGSVYTEHYGANSRVWYASFTTEPMGGSDMVDGVIKTDDGQTTYIIPKGVNQIEIPYSITAKAELTQYAVANDILSLKSIKDNKNASVARQGTVTLNGLKHTIKRSDFPVSDVDVKKPIKLTGRVSILNVFQEEQTEPVEKDINVVIQADNDDPGIRATAVTNPNSVKFNNADIRVKLDATGELYNYDNASNVKEWKFYAKEKNDTTNATLQTKVVSGNVLSQKTSFNFTIPKARMSGANYTQVYAVTAVAVFKNAVAGKASLSAPAEAATFVYKETAPPPDPEPDPNIPPVAVIGGPSEVDAGSEFTLNGSSSYDPDGTVVDYRWGRPSGCGLSEDYGDSQKIVCGYPGTYTFGLTVIDNKGAQSKDAYHTVVVKPPLPKAFIRVGGTLKQNRKVVTDGSTSYEPPGAPISKYEWEITAVSGGTNADVKYAGSANDVSKEVLFKQEGTYRVKLTVWNHWGSDTAEKTITIKPDLPPIMESSSITPVYRQSYYENQALIELEDFSYSGDGDYINARTVAVAFDNNNDGTCANDTYTTLSSTAGKRYSYAAPQVGNYCFKISATETFGEPTIPQFITPADYRSGMSEVKVNVDNYAPSTSFGLLKKKFVDINFNLGESNYASLDELKTKVNTLVLPELAANGIDAKITYGDARPAASKLFYFYTIKNNEYYTQKPFVYNPETGITKELDQKFISGTVMPDETIIYRDATGSLQKYDPATGNSTHVYTPPEHYISSWAINKLGNIFYTSMWVVGHSGFMRIGVFMYDPVTRITTQIHQSDANGNGHYGYSNLQASFNGNVSVQYADSGSIWSKTHASFSPTGLS
ncbi:PKD domain-containing protein [Cohnella cholangitidis]|uniref:PKD/Chitinase domain-containing protein n=1 Tax=Cohnella cholangitidis TaxID=2598458 RepID=A0A7G5BV24_9BACL|nr:PKD domain-containing protein [Cohnella cholangitidis]QMV40808.1 hypothetical protein FPL14_05995 [Cohnella cholangitidis]